MAEARDLLVEIGTEELPPKALKKLSTAFCEGIVGGLGKAGLKFGEVSAYATPRRLAVLVRDLPGGQSDRAVERRGPALAAAYDDEGFPSKAAQGFAQSCGVAVADLDKLETPKGSWLVFRSIRAGRPTVSLLPEIVEESLARLPIPKRMRWGNLKVEFVRPVHWVVMLYGDQVVDGQVLGIVAGRDTRGHRFHHPGPIAISSPAAYVQALESEGRVLVEFDRRSTGIRAQVERLAGELGGRAVIDPDLLDEVTSLVEWPVAIAGGFEERFLDVPAEALVATMKGNQKYFHVVDAEGRLMPHFIAVANIQSRNPQAVRAGNERVVRPRLADAEFFWKQDRALPLASRLEALADVVYQQKLGSLKDRCLRMARVGRAIAEHTGGRADLAERAAALSKCDLMTQMVGEFPELQGTMGRYYALHDGEPEEVALALDEQYMPRFAGDRLPGSPTGRILALADRLDTLVGIFGIGQAPTGDKDPFGLRRAALGVLRILIEGDLDVDLEQVLLLAAQAYDLFEPEPVAAQVFDFAMDRLRGYYLDAGVAPDTFDAVLARRPTRPADFDRRIRAVTEFRAMPQAASLAAANKRIHNILKKAQQPVADGPDPSLLADPAELRLAEDLLQLQRTVEPLLANGAYGPALSALAELRDTVDNFFDQVLVMAEDPALRGNRLALLSSLSELFLRTADISRLQT